MHEPWTKFPFNTLLQDPRQVLATDILHDSVLARWQSGNSYRPAALGAFARTGLGALRHEP